MLRIIKILIPAFLVLTGMQAAAQTPVIKVRFNNPEYDFSTQTYSLDVELQSNTAAKKLYSFDVRFFYDENILEFISFSEFLGGYTLVGPPTVTTSNPSGGPAWFGFGGAYEKVAATVWLSGSTTTYISTTGWTKYFNVSFHVDDPTAAISDTFCPSVVWDLEEDPIYNGFGTTSGGVIILVRPITGSPEPTTENVIQYNWVYDGIPGIPYGYPQNITCMSTRVAPRVTVDSLLALPNDYLTFSVPVNNFFDISALTLTLDYNPAVMEYCCVVPNALIANNFTTNQLYAGRIQMVSSSMTAAIPNQDTLCQVTFKYLGGSCDLAWYDAGTTCQYTNAVTGLVLYDSPAATYYKNGLASNGEYTWIGGTSTDWNTVSNWQNNVKPGRFSKVIINSNPMPSSWPTFTGDMSIGITCGNITLNGSAQLNTTGDLIVNPGFSIDITGTGMINIGGDLSNSGTFNSGSGTVAFNSTDSSAITVGENPINYVTGFCFSTFSPGMTPLSNGIMGPSGDNAHSDVPIGFEFTYLDVDYTQVRINTNGWLSLNLSGPDNTSLNNLQFFNTALPSVVLAPWWDDLNADASSTISYKTEGTEPNRIFTAEWKDVLAYSTGATARLNLQVKLYETSNIIEFCYGSLVAGSHNSAEGASIGLKDQTGGPGRFIEARCGTANQTIGCLNSTSGWPCNNYRFTPPPVQITDLMIHSLEVTGNLILERDVTITGIE
jgi:hypothetical protein